MVIIISGTWVGTLFFYILNDTVCPYHCIARQILHSGPGIVGDNPCGGYNGRHVGLRNSRISKNLRQKRTTQDVYILGREIAYNIRKKKGSAHKMAATIIGRGQVHLHTYVMISLHAIHHGDDVNATFHME